MIIYNKTRQLFYVSIDRQTFLGFEMTLNLRDTSPFNVKLFLSCDRHLYAALTIQGLDYSTQVFSRFLKFCCPVDHFSL